MKTIDNFKTLENTLNILKYQLKNTINWEMMLN